MSGRLRELVLLLACLIVTALAVYAAGVYSVGNTINDFYFQHVDVRGRIKFWVAIVIALAGLIGALVRLVRMARLRRSARQGAPGVHLRSPVG